jgi:hypothetical protein
MDCYAPTAYRPAIPRTLAFVLAELANYEFPPLFESPGALECQPLKSW